MFHQPQLNSQSAETQDPAAAPSSHEIELQMTDRSQPRWAVILGATFASGSAACLLAIPVLALFFSTIVGDGGELGMVLPLVGLGLVLLLGMAVLDFAHGRSLAGYRDSRDRVARRIQAGLAVLLAIAMMTLHPALGLPIFLAATIGALGHLGLARLGRSEGLWDFLPTEAVSVLSGRDRLGHLMAAARPRLHAMSNTLVLAVVGLGVLLSVACGTWLIAEEVLAPQALLPVVLVSAWAVVVIQIAILDGAGQGVRQPAQVVSGPPPEDFEMADGLTVYGLSVFGPDDRPLLSDLGVALPPGTITGLMGESGSGKSLFLQALSDPFALTDMQVVGHVTLNGTDLWQRDSAAQMTPAVYLPSRPFLLPASGEENLTCFHGPLALERGKWLLEQLVFARDMVDSICATQDARRLPSMQAKALGMARAVLLAPQLYLMDRPEDGLPDAQIAALLRMMQKEVRLGRSFIIATDNRALLDACDQVIVLQEGQAIDYGTTREVRERIEAGWSRFIGERLLETQANLEVWVRSHFRRGGDEANRRKVALIVSELLTLSCQTAAPMSPGQISFTFKHFVGHCILRMTDDDAPISAAQLEMAREAAANSYPGQMLPPLATLMRDCQSVEIVQHNGDRLIEVSIATYDPRKSKPPAAGAGRDDKA